MEMLRLDLVYSAEDSHVPWFDRSGSLWILSGIPGIPTSTRVFGLRDDIAKLFITANNWTIVKQLVPVRHELSSVVSQKERCPYLDFTHNIEDRVS